MLDTHSDIPQARLGIWLSQVCTYQLTCRHRPVKKPLPGPQSNQTKSQMPPLTSMKQNGMSKMKATSLKRQFKQKTK